MLPHDEGGPTVSGKYRIIEQYPTIRVLSGNRVVDAETITVEEDLYGLVFSVTKPVAEWRGTPPGIIALDYTSWSQEIAKLPHVLAMTYAEDLNAAGLLIDVWYVIVGTADGLNTAQVTVPFSLLDTPAAFQRIADTWETVRNMAGL